MKWLSARSFAMLGVAAVMVSGTAFAATDCNLAASPCTTGGPSFSCQGGCGPVTFVGHLALNPCNPGRGSFDLRNTQYASTCSNAIGGCTNILVPPFRFWQFDNYAGATGNNSGCQIRNAPSSTNWYANAELDFGLTAAPGRWLAYQASWNGPGLDGCAGASGGTNRTITEVSSPVVANEGMVTHSAWYLLTSVNDMGGNYDYDRVTGSTGCAVGDVPTALVPSVTIAGRTDPCVSSTVVTFGTNNAADGTNYGDIPISLSDVNGQWFNESGRNGAPDLIAGFQIVYKSAPEPTSSIYSTGGWFPVRDTATPAMARAIIPRGAAGPYTVTIPKAAGNVWLAARVVYSAGAAANPAGTFDPATAGPRVTSPVGPHCGPVNFGGIITAVTFDSVTATRTPQGVLVRWTTSFEDDVNGFVVYRSQNPAGSTDGSDAVMPWASARGAGFVYEFLDSGAVGSSSYYYVIQEQTFSGPGASSAVVPVHTVASEDAAVGGRSRK